ARSHRGAVALAELRCAAAVAAMTEAPPPYGQARAYVVGFLFRPGTGEVALIRKQRPEWQRGLLNGVGGKIELGESAIEAMRREFREEAGADIVDWRPFALLHWRRDVIHFFTSRAPARLESKTDEPVAWYPTHWFPILPLVPNLRWLVPLAYHGAPNLYANII